MQTSVIIPVYNSAADLNRCLTALETCERSPFECIVVDDGSDDDSALVAERHGARVIRLPARSGPAVARNRGAAAAGGDLLFFIDADVCVGVSALETIERVFSDPGVAAVMGSYDDQPADPGFVSQYKNLSHHYVHQRSQEEASTFWSGCGAVRREVFVELGGFDEGYGQPCIEDIELGYRMRARGHAIRLEKQLLVTHLKRWTLPGLVRTDIFQRGVPWILLMLRDRHMVNDLNLTWHSRVGTVLTYALLLGGILLSLGSSWPVPITLITILTACVAAGQAATRKDLGSWLLVTAAVAAGAWLGLQSQGALLSGSWLYGILALLLATNAGYYAFFREKRGLAFACGVLPMHLLFFLYSGLCIPLGLLSYIRATRQRQLQAHQIERSRQF
jgi:GT2 family glycosyltransferase